MTRSRVSSIACRVLLTLLPAAVAAAPAEARPDRRLFLAQAAPTGGAEAPAVPTNGTSPAAGDTNPTPPPAPVGTPAPIGAPAASAPPSPSQSPPATQAATPNPADSPRAARRGSLRNGAGFGNTTGGIDTQSYGGTLSSAGRPQGSILPPYGSTQRNSGLSSYDNAQPPVGMAPYGGTQSTVGNPQYNGAIYGAPRNDAGVLTGTRSLTGTTLPANPADNTRAPLGGTTLSRDQIGNYGGTGGYNAQGVYTGVSGQSIGFGQPYAAANGRPSGGLLSTGADATGPLRPYIPLNTGRAAGPTNSGYGIPNGSRPTTMDARGIQRVN